MSDYAKVKDHKGLIRDMYSKAVLNVDEESLLDHRRKKMIMKDIVCASNKISELETDIKQIKAELETDIKQIKEMLFQLTKDKV
jgi:hypothetical protein